MSSENYHNGLRRLQKLHELSDLYYFYQHRVQEDSYAWEAIQALERGDEDTLKALPKWYTYVFPYPLPQEIDLSRPRYHWDISITNAISLLRERHYGWDIGYALYVLRHSDLKFLEKLFKADQALGTWLTKWLDGFAWVFDVAGVENNPEARRFCRDTHDDLREKQFVKAVPYERSTWKEMRAELEFFSPTPNEEQSPLARGIAKAESKSKADQRDSRQWADILTFLQRKKRFDPDSFKGDLGIQLVFPCPKTTKDCRQLLRDHRQAFRLGYATMVLKETITALGFVPGVDRADDSGGNKPEEPYVPLLEQVGKIEAIQYCMAIACLVLMADFATDNDASKTCADVLKIFYEGQVFIQEALDVVGELKDAESEGSSVQLIKNNRTRWEEWFHRGMSVAKDLDRTRDTSSKLEDKGVLWYGLHSHEWSERWTGKAWHELEKVRSTGPKGMKEGNN